MKDLGDGKSLNEDLHDTYEGKAMSKFKIWKHGTYQTRIMYILQVIHKAMNMKQMRMPRMQHETL